MEGKKNEGLTKTYQYLVGLDRKTVNQEKFIRSYEDRKRLIDRPLERYEKIIQNYLTRHPEFIQSRQEVTI